MDAPALLPLLRYCTIEAGRHFVLIDANGGKRRRQEEAQRLLCNRQRASASLKQQTGSCPAKNTFTGLKPE